MQDIRKIDKLVSKLELLITNNATFVSRVTFDSIRKKSRNYTWLQLQVLAKHQNELESVVKDLRYLLELFDYE